MPQRKVFGLLSVLFFVYLSDAILSDWVPGTLEAKLGGSVMMGLVMAFSSIIGLITDFAFPMFFNKFRSTWLLIIAIFMAIIFASTLYLSKFWPQLPLFLFAMGIWGLYYEFLSFGSQQFMADTVPAGSRSKAWAGFLGVKSVAYFIGPLLGGLLTLKIAMESVPVISLAFVGFGLISFIIWSHVNKVHLKTQAEAKTLHHHPNILTELDHWMTIGTRVWPILIMSFLIISIDSFYWSIGTILSDSLGKSHIWGLLFLPFYNLPSIFVSLILSNINIVQGKKKMSIIFLGLAGILMSFVGFVSSIPFLLLFSLGVGGLLSVSLPLLNAVYTDLLARLGRDKNHLIGLGNSTGSLAYVLGPIFAGLLSANFGHQMSFSILGVFVVVVCLILLVETPKKLKLPQTKIINWE